MHLLFICYRPDILFYLFVLPFYMTSQHTFSIEFCRLRHPPRNPRHSCPHNHAPSFTYTLYLSIIFYFSSSSL
ncbi:hypothetical protein L208DRAFT_310434 [Tricholoma matsutake]|nr:hypothetical protein L208DRAFT_310434 [Tricholoma matsutake 945]